MNIVYMLSFLLLLFLFFWLIHHSCSKPIFYVHYSTVCLLIIQYWGLLFMVQSTQRYLLVLIYSVIFHLFLCVYANYYAVHTLYCVLISSQNIYIFSRKLRVINNHSVDDEMERNNNNKKI